MIISVNWLKKFVDIDMPIDELVTLIGARLVEVEGTESLAEKYKDVIIAKVVSAEKVEGSDHLSLLYIDDGGVVSDVERNENGHVQVVCGAPNVRQDLFVAWLPPKSVVPETFGSDDPFTLSARPLMGHVSNGMIASARELDLYDEHDGILEVDEVCTPGSSFAEVYELNDTLIDIENKSLTHRPDAFGVIGFAREIAGIQGKAFTTPAWLQNLTGTLEGAGLQAPTVRIEDSSLSGRFQAIVIDGVSATTQSSILMQTYLSRSGVRPVNALVDLSNYLMLLTGQPTHTYDYAKLQAVSGGTMELSVRAAHDSETLTLLDEKEIQLDESDIVIAAGETVVGLAGIMGGKNTEVDQSTTTIVLEVATFDLYHLRSSQMRHGIFSEAVTRFTKGIPTELGRPVLLEAVSMLTKDRSATPASSLIDAYPEVRTHQVLEVPMDRVNGLLGTRFETSDCAQILESVEFPVTVLDGGVLQVTVPYWRNDIHIQEDVIEEIGRLSGFDLIQATMPARDFTAVEPGAFDAVRSALRAAFSRAGMNETLTYSFVHGDLLKRAGQNPENSYRITNSISPDLQYYRQSLLPSLLQHVNPNVRLGYGAFGLFEFNKVHEKSVGLNEESVPIETPSLALTIVDAKNTKDTAYYQAKYVLEYALKAVGIRVQFRPLEEKDINARSSVFEPQRSAHVVAEDGTTLGVIGEYRQSVVKAFKLPRYAAGFELLMECVAQHAARVPVQYRPMSRYPGVERDVCFRVDESVTYDALIEGVQGVLNNVQLETSVEPLDMYQAEGDSKKNITVRMSLVSHEKTLVADEVRSVIDQVIEEVTKKTHGEVV